MGLYECVCAQKSVDQWSVIVILIDRVWKIIHMTDGHHINKCLVSLIAKHFKYLFLN